MKPEDRFWAKVDKNGPVMPGMDTPCWVWTGSMQRANQSDDDFYGRFSIDGRMSYAHRLSYLWHNGGLPQHPDTVDHICSNTLCVRHDHLRALSKVGQQEHRRSLQSNNVSGYRGVVWYTRYQKWRAQAQSRGQSYFGGYYDDVEEANRAAIALRDRLMTHNVEGN